MATIRYAYEAAILERIATGPTHPRGLGGSSPTECYCTCHLRDPNHNTVSMRIVCNDLSETGSCRACGRSGKDRYAPFVLEVM